MHSPGLKLVRAEYCCTLLLTAERGFIALVITTQSFDLLQSVDDRPKIRYLKDSALAFDLRVGISTDDHVVYVSVFSTDYCSLNDPDCWMQLSYIDVQGHQLTSFGRMLQGIMRTCILW